MFSSSSKPKSCIISYLFILTSVFSEHENSTQSGIKPSALKVKLATPSFM